MVGGLAGMTAALGLADQGFAVHLIEKEAELGGQLRKIRYTLERSDVAGFLTDLVRKVEGHSKITVHRRTKVVEFAGQRPLTLADLRSKGPAIGLPDNHPIVVLTRVVTSRRPRCEGTQRAAPHVYHEACELLSSPSGQVPVGDFLASHNRDGRS